MLCIANPVTDIYFNLAAEEYLLKECQENIFMLWKSDPAVVVGKHQTALAEFNYKFVQERGIKVARRLTGGGTVFHDAGNLNFTFIQNGQEGKLIDFRKYTEPIQSALKKMGIITRFEEHNNLTVGGLKISGNAERIFKNRVLHHGTLLFSTDLKLLKEVLNIQPENYQHKGVRSVPSKVVNLTNILPGHPDIVSFQEQIMNFILKTGTARVYSFQLKETEQIKSLATRKYATWKWIYGYSPRYRFQKNGLLKNGTFHIRLMVEKGLITEIKFTSDRLSPTLLRQIEKALVGERHSLEDLKLAFENIPDREPELTEIKQSIHDIFF